MARVELILLLVLPATLLNALPVKDPEVVALEQRLEALYDANSIAKNIIQVDILFDHLICMAV